MPAYRFVVKVPSEKRKLDVRPTNNEINVIWFALIGVLSSHGVVCLEKKRMRGKMFCIPAIILLFATDCPLFASVWP